MNFHSNRGYSLQGWIKADFEAALKDLNSLMCDNKRYLKGVGACDDA